MYTTEHTLTDQPLTIIVCHSELSHERAKELFDAGEQVGDWYWKHCTWVTTDDQLDELLEAIGYFYGPLDQGNLKVTYRDNGGVEVEAWYGAN